MAFPVTYLHTGELKILKYCVLVNSTLLMQQLISNTKDCVLHARVITGSIAQSTKRRYFSYSEADFEVFHPAGLTRCTDGCEIWHGGGDRLRAKFHPNRCNGKGIGPPKLKFLLRFDQNVEYKRPTVAYLLRDFYKICRVCTPFQDTSVVRILLDLLLELRGFKLTGSGYPQIFSAP